MSKIKMTGEYQVTWYGVEIEGMVHDTRIPEIREKFGRAGAHGFLVGMSTGDESQQYKMLGSRWFNQMRVIGLVSNKQVDDILGIKDVGNTIPIATEFQRSGILEASGANTLLLCRRVDYNKHKAPHRSYNDR